MTLFISLQPVAELLRILSIKSSEDKLYSVAQLFLSCISLNFRDEMIIAAHVDSSALHRGCRIMLAKEVTVAAIKIQSIVRMHQVQVHCKTFTAKQQKIRNAVRTAKRRVNKFYREHSVSLQESSIGTYTTLEQPSSFSRRSKSPTTTRYLTSKTPQPPRREKPSRSGALTSPRPVQALRKSSVSADPTPMPDDLREEIRELRQEMLSVVSHVDRSVSSLLQQQFTDSVGDSITLSEQVNAHDTFEVPPVIASSLESDDDDLSFTQSSSFVGKRLMRKASVAPDNEAEQLRFELTKLQLQLSVLQGQLEYQRKLNASMSFENSSLLSVIPAHISIESPSVTAQMKAEESASIAKVNRQAALKRFRDICMYYIHRRKMSIADVLRLRTLLENEELTDIQDIFDGMKFAKQFGHVELAQKMIRVLGQYFAMTKVIPQNDVNIFVANVDFYVLFLSDFMSIEFVQRKGISIMFAFLRLPTEWDMITLMGAARAGEVIVRSLCRHIDAKDLCMEGLKCLIRLCHKHIDNCTHLSNENTFKMVLLLFDSYSSAEDVISKICKFIAVLSMRSPRNQDLFAICGVTSKILEVFVSNLANVNIVSSLIQAIVNLIANNNEQNGAILSSRAACQSYHKALRKTLRDANAFVQIGLMVIAICARSKDILANFPVVDMLPMFRSVISDKSSQEGVLQSCLMMIHTFATHGALKTRFVAEKFDELIRPLESSPNEQIRKYASLAVQRLVAPRSRSATRSRADSRQSFYGSRDRTHSASQFEDVKETDTQASVVTSVLDTAAPVDGRGNTEAKRRKKGDKGRIDRSKSPAPSEAANLAPVLPAVVKASTSEPTPSSSVSKAQRSVIESPQQQQQQERRGEPASIVRTLSTSSKGSSRRRLTAQDRIDEIRAEIELLQREDDYALIMTLRPSAITKSLASMARYVTSKLQDVHSEDEKKFMLLNIKRGVILAQLKSIRMLRAWVRRRVSEIRFRKLKKEAIKISSNIRKCANIPTLAHALEVAVSIGDCELCSAAFSRVNTLVTGTHGKMYIPDIKTHASALIKAMGEFLSIMMIQRAAVDTFGVVMASNPNVEWVDAVLNDGLGSTVIASLKRHIKHGELSYNHIKFFNRLVGVCQNSKDAIVCAETCQVIFMALEKYMHAQLMIDKVCRGISLLCYQSVTAQDIFHELAIPPLLVQCMREYSEKAETLISVCRCVGNLMARSHTPNQIAFGKQEYCEYFADLLMLNLNRPEVYQALTMVITAACSNQVVIKRTFASTSLPNTLIRSLTASSGDVDVMQSSLSILYSLLTDTEIQHQLQMLGIEGVFKHLESHPSDQVRINTALCMRRVLLSRSNVGSVPTTRNRSAQARNGGRRQPDKAGGDYDDKPWDFASHEVEMAVVDTPIKPMTALPDKSRHDTDDALNGSSPRAQQTIVKTKTDPMLMEAKLQVVSDSERTSTSKRDALLRLQRAVKFHINKAREKESQASRMLRATALLQTIDTSGNLAIIFEAMKVSMECGHATLAESTSSRLSSLLSEKGALQSNNVIEDLSKDCKVIFDLMSAFQSNADVQIACTNVLLRVLNIKDSKLDEAFSEQGVCAAIYGALDRHFSKVEMCSELLKCLLRLVSFHAPSRLRASSPFGIEVIVKLLNYYPVTSPVCEVLCRCLYVLSMKTPEVQMRFARAGAMDRLILFLRQSINDNKGFARISKVIVALCTGSDDERLKIIFSESNCKVLLQAMFACLRSTTLREMILLYIAMSGCSKSFMRHLVHGGFIDVLHTAIRDRMVDDNTVLMILNFLDALLARIAHIEQKALEEIEQLVQPLVAQDDNKAIKEKASTLLANKNKIKFYFETDGKGPAKK